MYNLQALKNKQEFENLKPNDKLIVEYSNEKMYLLDVIRIENGDIVGRIDFNGIQETFINIERLVNEYIRNHIKSVMKMIKS